MFGIDIGVFIWLIILAIVGVIMGGIIIRRILNLWTISIQIRQWSFHVLNQMAVKERREIREHTANQDMMKRMEEMEQQKQIREERRIQEEKRIQEERTIRGEIQ